MNRRQHDFESPYSTFRHFFLPSVALMMVCLVGSTSCNEQQGQEEKGFWLKVAVHVINDLPDPLRVQCKSKDTDIGLHILPTGQNLTWRFVPHIVIQNTLFFCHCYWRNKEAVFNVYDKFIDVYCTTFQSDDENCYWSVQPDGIYFSGTNKIGSYAKWYLWN
ncbi:S-protein homolog 5-like [Diospyros lotus]|uniref:S-protein homolog 5-like n=1 Tax=Diospyros lotus TaxID=55363 RepID=UPI00224E2D68|nr:S-protein homolog 5-like [Diospyros lotus]XP_052180223.1 S-protein homolog 5-like [Diospyros lotus]XP_052206918.1 S-protein homolog 5-like [Diospyros lotus]